MFLLKKTICLKLGRLYALFYAAGISLMILQTSCSIGPEYVKPIDTSVKNANYKEMGGQKVSENDSKAVKKKWWQIFNDPILNSLEEEINVSNQNLAKLEAQYRQAQALVSQAKAAYFPSVSIGASYTHSYDSTVAGMPPKNRDSLLVPITISWELDILGKNRRSVEANQANANASLSDIESTKLLIQAQLAQYYFQLRTLDLDQQTLDSTVEAYQKYYDMTNFRYVSGVAAKGDVLQAETQLKTTKAQSIDLGIQRAQLVNAIAVLLGKPAFGFNVAATEVTIKTPLIPVSVPSDLIKRRPDIIAAEQRLQFANAQIGVARANFFPVLSLGASAGVKSADASSLTDKNSRYYQAGPTITQTIFDGGLRTSLSDQAKAVFDANYSSYRQTVLTAFQEVEDNLAALRILEKEALIQNEAVKAAEQSLEFITNQYKAGTVSYFNVIIAQSTALSSKRTANEILSRRMAASALLIKALGGGWE